MTAAIIPFPIQRARQCMTRASLLQHKALALIATDAATPAQERADALIELINTAATPAMAATWQLYSEGLIEKQSGGAA